MRAASMPPQNPEARVTALNWREGKAEPVFLDPDVQPGDEVSVAR